MALVTCRAVAVMGPWPKLWVASATSERAWRSWPRSSPGSPTPVRSPKPKAASPASRRSRPRRAAMRAAPMFELWAMIRDGPAQLRAAWSWITWAPMVVAAVPAVDGVERLERAALQRGRDGEGLHGRAGLEGIGEGPVAQLIGRARRVGVGGRPARHGQHLAGLRARCTTAMPESAREESTARASARSAVAWMPWSRVSSTRSPSRSAPGTGASASRSRPLPSRIERTSAERRPAASPPGPAPAPRCPRRPRPPGRAAGWPARPWGSSGGLRDQAQPLSFSRARYSRSAASRDRAGAGGRPRGSGRRGRLAQERAGVLAQDPRHPPELGLALLPLLEAQARAGLELARAADPPRRAGPGRRRPTARRRSPPGARRSGR